MHNKKKEIRLVSEGLRLCTLLISLGVAVPAYAYLDPGTGSIILQGLIASFMVIAAAVAAFWHRIKSFISSLFSLTKSTSGSDRDTK